MVKRTKDLFRLLEERERAGRQDRASSNGERGAAAMGNRVAQWAQDAWQRVAPGDAPRRPGRAGMRMSGVGIAATILASLGVGLLVGRAMPRTPATTELQARSPAPQRPGPVGAPADAGRDDKDAERLSSFFYPVLRFDVSERQRAAAAAAYLRANGVETARIHEFKVQGQPKWVVVAYAASVEDGSAVLARLRAVAPSKDWPQLGEAVQAITDLKKFKS
jgi:hypothetical protein